MLATFVGNNAWFGVFLSLHVLGAVIGLGPTFAFSILGPMAEKASPDGGLALLEGIDKIENGMVNPILLTTQPATGILLIFNRGLNHGFFSINRLWLIGGITAYLLAVYIALLLVDPALRRMISLAKGGEAGTPGFGAAAARVKSFSPILTVLGVIIVVLMIWKPGSHCLYQC